jgi:hypothetical protein
MYIKRADAVSFRFSFYRCVSATDSDHARQIYNRITKITYEPWQWRFEGAVDAVSVKATGINLLKPDIYDAKKLLWAVVVNAGRYVVLLYR